MITEKRKETIKLIVAITILALLLLFVAIMMIKYEVEGETNMPYQLSKIVVIGTVEGVETEEKSKEKWNFDIYQNNDVYFYIDQNTNNIKEDELIKSVKISNIQIKSAPQKGTLKTYMPNSEAGRIYTYDEQFLVEEKLEYKGSSGSNASNLEIGSKGGQVLIRFSNSSIGNYTSDKDKEIVHNNTLLKKIKAINEEIKFSITCDFTIETTKAKYQAEIELELPTGNLDEEENCYLEKTDMKDIIFKRVK
ncbi:MAG: hypothetical protein HFJ29_09555 [Clostridia bacterium]|nr:hypothetical protein [Clostridia bacterium]